MKNMDIIKLKRPVKYPTEVFLLAKVIREVVVVSQNVVHKKAKIIQQELIKILFSL